MTDSLPERSDDTLLAGRLVCQQHVKGYRFSIDPILLAHFVQPSAQATILDLGAGCGVAGLLCAHLHPGISVTAYELQPALANLCARNFTANKLNPRCQVVEGDVRTRNGLQAESMDLVICNPPYGRLRSGRLNPASEQAIARHELQGSLADFCQAAAFAVKNRGRVCFVYPARRLATLFSTLQSQRLEPKRLRPVYSYPGSEGKLVLLEAMKNGGEELRLEQPLFIYDQQNGAYSAEVAALLEPET